jgi:integrase
MSRTTAKLTAKSVEKLSRQPGRHNDGEGLFLRTVAPDKAYWCYRYRAQGREREMSLGPYPEVTLAEAREKHAALRKQVVADKVDPLAARDKGKSPAIRSASGAPIFAHAAEDYLERQERRGAWKNARHRGQWRSTLLKLLPEAFLKLPVTEIDARVVFDALDPIWERTPETGSRLRGRIETVLDFAREPDDVRPNPAALTGWLKTKLGSAKELGKVDKKIGARVPRGHHAAMPYKDMPAFVASLRLMDSAAARALEFLILTGTRTSEAIAMPWSEIGDGAVLDQLKPTWWIPQGRMKAGAFHEVPLSDRAVEILRGQLARRSEDSFGPHEYVFEGDRPRQPLSNMSLLMLLRRMGSRVTAHGFRSSLRDWCSEAGVDFETAEMILAHRVGNAVTQSYLRTTNLERRRAVIQRWSDYVSGKQADNVIELRRAAE